MAETTSPAHSPTPISPERVFARIAPVAENRAIRWIGGRLGEIFQHSFQLHFADALDEILETFAGRPVRHVSFRQARDHFRNTLGRNRHDGQAVRAAVVLPLAAQHHLEVRHGVSADLAADAVEAEVGHVMLAATVEAAADLDVQILHGFVQLETFLGERFVQLGRQSARGGNSQLAGVRAGAGDDIDDRARAGIAKAHGFERLVNFGQIALADPANDEILLDRGANGFLGEAADDVRE